MDGKVKSKLLLILVIISLSFITFPFIATAFPKNENGRTYVYTSTIIYINRGSSELILDKGYRIFNIFMNTSWQTVYLLRISHPFGVTEDPDGNPCIVLDVPPIPSGGNVSVTFSLRIIVKQRMPPSLNLSTSGNLSDIPRELQEYTKGVGTWLTENQTLKDLAYGIGGKKTNVLEIVTSLANWIGNNISSYSSDVPLYPTDTYNSRKGDCDDQANLLITLSRILGIPAYLQIGLLETSSQKKETYWNGHVTSSLKYVGYHGWAVAYVPPWGWLPFDMTLGWKSSNPLEVVTSASIWNLNAIQMMDVTKSDWAGEGLKQREALINSQLYLQYEDILIEEGSESWLRTLSQNWQTLAIIAITVVVIGFTIRIYRKRK